MLSDSRRHLLVIGLLLLGIGFTWGQRWAQAARLEGDIGPAHSDPAPGLSGLDSHSPSSVEASHTYFLDVEGWYRITPRETVVRSPYNLTGGTSEEIAAALPASVGRWRQVGEDQFIADDPGVVQYLNQPTVALQRIYVDPSDQFLILSVLGNKGDDSFLLFSHTPQTCLPGRLWEVVESRLASATIDDRSMFANYLLTEHAETGEKQGVLYWYLWASPQRDSQDGVLSMRVYLPVPPGRSEADVVAAGWDFVRELFPATLPWDRF